VQRITADQPVDADCRRAETAGDRRSPAGRIDEKSYLDRLRLALRGDNSLPKSRPVSTLKSQRSRPRATVASIRSLAMPAERFSGTTYNSVITPNDPAAYIEALSEIMITPSGCCFSTAKKPKMRSPMVSNL
jgi:hypothetical protein